MQKSYRRTDGWTDIKCLSNGRKNLITLKDQTNKNVSKFSRNMFTEIRCEICINHLVEIIFTLSCAVVDINLLQINCSQNFLLKMCKKIVELKYVLLPPVGYIYVDKPSNPFMSIDVF